MHNIDGKSLTSLNNNNIFIDNDKIMSNLQINNNLQNKFILEEECFLEIKNNLEKELKRNMISLQGSIMELQRLASNKEEFDSNFYNSIKKVKNGIEELEVSMKLVDDQLNYVKTVLESIKVSQELSEDFSK